jgi:hypothetical protein
LHDYARKRVAVFCLFHMTLTSSWRQQIACIVCTAMYAALVHPMKLAGTLNFYASLALPQQKRSPFIHTITTTITPPTAA